MAKDGTADIRQAQSSGQASSGTHRGIDGLKVAAEQMRAPFAKGADIAIQFKIFQVELDGDRGTSVCYVDTDGSEASGRVGSSGVQQNATWTCQWARADAKAPWKLSGIRVDQFEEVAYSSPTGRLFADCTEAVLGKTAAYAEQLIHSGDRWRIELESNLGIDAAGLCGLAVGDANGDGLDDLYYCDLGGLPKRLFLQNADGTVRDASAESGVDWHDRSRAALFVDLDNDGDQDLVIGFQVEIMFMENDGKGRFRQKAVVPANPIPKTLTAVDYDHDGRLDIFSPNYGNNQESFGDERAPLPWWDANNGAANQMLRNEIDVATGKWEFRDTTAEIGLDHNNRKYSFGATWDDVDNDGDLDLYIANDFGRKNLYLNEKGRFRDVAAEAGVEDIGAGMSACFGDYDNDGRTDIYVANMFSGAGTRITHKSKFKSGMPQDVVDAYRRFARGNSLFRNLGNGKFEDVSLPSGTTYGRWGWCSLFVDLNNDSWQDIVAMNGYVTSASPDDL
jgi:hypothetical protein